MSQENLDETQAKLMAGMDEVTEILGKLPVDQKLGMRRVINEHGSLTGSYEYYSNHMKSIEKDWLKENRLWIATFGFQNNQDIDESALN
ncbi:MAG: hypothetical protein R2688_08105 [Fimbriimonadaceae bacterium]